MSEEIILPTGWTLASLGDYIIKGGGSIDPSKYPEEIFDLYSIPAYDSQKPDVIAGSKIGSTKKIIQENDVLLSRIVPHIQRSWVVARNAGRRQIGSGEWIIFRGENIIPQFMKYYLLSYDFYRKFMGTISGVGGSLTRANPNQVAQFKFPLPPLNEQQTIVSKIEELFSELENGKQQLQTALQQLKVYRQSLLKWAFEGKLTNEDVKDGELPKGWKWVKLGDVCSNVEYGSATKSKTTGKIPVLRMGNIQNGVFDWNDLVYTDDEDEINKYLLKKNDVLFNRTNSAEWVGKTAIYKGERPAIFAGYLIRINRIESLIDAQYLTYFLNTQYAKSYGNSVRSFGVNQSNINGTKLKTYPIPLAPLEEQQRIVDELESKLTNCDKIEETINQCLQQSETLRQSIFKKAFEGELVKVGFND